MSEQTVDQTSTNNQRVRCESKDGVSPSNKSVKLRCQRTKGHDGGHTFKGYGIEVFWGPSTTGQPKKRSHHKAKPKAPVDQTAAYKAPMPVAALDPVNHIAFCLDSSGSMSSVKDAAISAYNSNLAQIRANAVGLKQKTDVSLLTFGEYGVDVRVKSVRESVNSIADLNSISYRPSGNTPLLDCVGDAIDTLEASPDATQKHVSFLVMVTTDGEENASRRWNADSLKRRMQALIATDRWTFVFLLPPHAKASFCQRYGIPDGNVMEWEATTRGVQIATMAVNAGVAAYYGSRKLGASSTRSFFTDLSKVSASDVKRALVDMKDDVHVMKVEKEVDIKTFCESKGYVYTIGKAYYQLTKNEDIQSDKLLLVREKNKTAIYGGIDARSVLGLPAGDVRVRPGNHANFDLFVQSKSVNRKLVRGTVLLYVKK